MILRHPVKLNVVVAFKDIPQLKKMMLMLSHGWVAIHATNGSTSRVWIRKVFSVMKRILMVLGNVFIVGQYLQIKFTLYKHFGLQKKRVL